jgi:hypothetical protein
MVEKMDKIVGNIVIGFLSLVTICLDARIVMELRTENGAQNQVVVGQPFTLDVIIEDLYGSVQAPTIKGLNGFAARQSGTYMSSINGKSTARYSYQVRIDTVGSYVLGPAVLQHQQQEFVSNELRVDVVKDVTVVASQNNKGSQAAEAKAFLRLMVDSESVVVGQKIGCILRFYYQDQSLSLHNIGMPELPGFDIKEIGKLESGTAEIDGIPYRYAQWQWDMYPTKPGECMIPAHNADYDIPTKDNHMFGGFFMFANNRVDRKRVYSNAVSIKVSPLPHCDHEVHAVGTFERIFAEIKPGMAKAGEGMVLVIEVEGVGNLPAIAVPVLKLPKALKYYDSNNAIIAPKHSDELPKKRFEFIVQGIESGDFEIPEQLFNYFDIERNAYTTLRTSPLAVSIMPGVYSAKKDIITPSSPTVPLSLIAESDEKIAGINGVGQWYPVAERKSLPWWLFQLLFLIPCVYLGYPFIVDKFIMLTGNGARLARRRAFKQARKKIDFAVNMGEDKNLYAIFMQLFQELGYDSHLSPFVSSTQQWSEFFERVTHAAYAQLDNKNSEELCRMAQEWIKRLEKII